MVKRDIESYGKHKELFQQVFNDGLDSLKATSGTLTVFHEILVDRVADSYVELVNSDEDEIKKIKSKERQEKLQKWLSMVFQEVHSLSVEMASRQIFYKQVLTVITDTIEDVELRKKLLSNLLDVMKRNKLDKGDLT